MYNGVEIVPVGIVSHGKNFGKNIMQNGHKLNTIWNVRVCPSFRLKKNLISVLRKYLSNCGQTYFDLCTRRYKL